MSLFPQQFAALEGAVNRLAAESVLASVGRDDGLVPAYSLVMELRDLVVEETVLHAPLCHLLAALERCLDTAEPFSDALLRQLRTTVEWLQSALDRAQRGATIPPFVASVTPAPVPAVVSAAPFPTSAAKVDVLMELNLAENQELLVEFHAEVVDHLQQIEAALLLLLAPNFLCLGILVFSI